MVKNKSKRLIASTQLRKGDMKEVRRYMGKFKRCRSAVLRGLIRVGIKSLTHPWEVSDSEDLHNSFKF